MQQYSCLCQKAEVEEGPLFLFGNFSMTLSVKVEESYFILLGAALTWECNSNK